LSHFTGGARPKTDGAVLGALTGLKMLGGNEFRLRQGFAGAKRLHAAVAAIG